MCRGKCYQKSAYDQECAFKAKNGVSIDKAREVMGVAVEQAFFEPSQKIHIERVFDASSQNIGGQRKSSVLGDFFLNVIDNYSHLPQISPSASSLFQISSH